jgi:exodeoxyribonuclease VII large subunit
LNKAQSVSQLLNLVKAQLSADYRHIWVRGEVGQWTVSSKGHIYFTLKDRQGLLNSVIWASRSEWLDFEPTEGMSVLALGALTIYPQRGQLQFTVEQLVPDGIGQYFAALEKLKQKLAAEGLFEPGRKRPLPFFPTRVGVVTSLEGAVWHDIQTTLQRRNPAVQLILSPAPVQGPEAVGKLVQALRRLLEHDVDVVILARGGGSWEDLMAFNHEYLVRFLGRYPVPLLTAIGHETDFSLADAVADQRAPTATAAAELVAPELSQLCAAVQGCRERLEHALRRRVQRQRELLEACKARWPMQQPERWLEPRRRELDAARERLRSGLQRLAERQRQDLQRCRSRLQPLLLLNSTQRQQATLERCRQSMREALLWRLERQGAWLSQLQSRLQLRALAAQCAREHTAVQQLQTRLAHAMKQSLSRRRGACEEMQALLQSLAPQAILKRGYAICLDKQGRPVTTVGGRNPGDRLEISLADGSLDCLVERILPDPRAH